MKSFYLIVIGALKRINCLNIMRGSLHHGNCREMLKLEFEFFYGINLNIITQRIIHYIVHSGVYTWLCILYYNYNFIRKMKFV